jgi:hypothetical protein
MRPYLHLVPRLAGIAAALATPALATVDATKAVAPKLTAVHIAALLKAKGLPIKDVLNSPVPPSSAGQTTDLLSEALFRDTRVLKETDTTTEPTRQVLCAQQSASNRNDLSCGGNIYVWKTHGLALSNGTSACGFHYRFVAGDVSVGISWYQSSGLTISQARTYLKPLAAILGQSVTFYHTCPAKPQPK